MDDVILVITMKVKWLIYTVLVGMIPILSRILIWAVLKSTSIPIFNASDFVTFGLVLNVSNFNEIEHAVKFHDKWKTVQNGTSLCFISFFMVLFSVYIVGESDPSLVNVQTIKIMSIVMSAVSLLLSLSIYNRISTIKGNG